MRQIHNIEPIYNKDSIILILGSFPSVKSREAKFFYHHPQNRFWKVLAHIYKHDALITIEDKKNFLLENHIAVWDTIESCDIKGSSDSSIENVKANDINKILEVAHIQAIYTNGKKSHQMYQKYLLDKTHKEDICLPSTSSANASYSLEKLIEYWKVIKSNHIE